MSKSNAFLGRAPARRILELSASISSRVSGYCVIAASGVLALGLITPGVQAATINVTTTTQKVTSVGGCSLQEAIFAVNFQSNKAIDPSNLNGPPITTGCTAGNGVSDTIVLAAGQV